jgi:dimethylhistidine N-methyltransferase
MTQTSASLAPVNQFAEEVRAGLSKAGQKELPSKYFYDDVGSALFEVICLLPEYGLTRADERLLSEYAEEIVVRLPGALTVAELGSGSGRKTRFILEALGARRPTAYCPIEISAAALAMCKRELGDVDGISIVGFESEYLDGLREVTARRRQGEHLLVLFLGSTIGNFDDSADTRFLREIRRLLQPGDALLLGTDLEKPMPMMLAAYDDPQGVTASFNLNLLARINRELDADFDLAQFEHVARFNRQTSSVEMHLRSRREQTVHVDKANLTVPFQPGETIWTENSRKYSVNELIKMATQSSFYPDAQWIDEEWPFAESLWIAA